MAGQFAETSHGWLILTGGIEQNPGAKRGWVLELGLGGGMRVAVGYRWRREGPARPPVRWSARQVQRTLSFSLQFVPRATYICGTKGRGMSKEKNKKGRATTPPSEPSLFDQARDELFSHILRCGVIEADGEQQKAWMDDTMQYLAERYSDLNEEQLTEIRVLGDRFCKPVVRRQPAGTVS